MKSGLYKISSKHQLIVLLILSVGLNFKTLFHEYALDDIVVMTENRFVEKGIKGIPEILFNDLMTGFTSKELLTQPRYRPFSLVIFALEHEFFGENPFVSHLVNVLFFALLIALLFLLFKKYIFQNHDKDLPFVICLLFAVHPVHTEVIANVKSRDELITFVLLVTSLIFIIRYSISRKVWQVFVAAFCFFIALLTRESAVTFIGVVPLVFYFFHKQPVRKLIYYSVPFLVVFAAYMAIRQAVIGPAKPSVSDVMNAPYLYATATEAFATKVFILLKYVWLLVYPHSLSSDYSYIQIPYIEIYSVQFIFSAIVVIVLVVCAFAGIKAKSVSSFSILYFLITISLVLNFLVDVGTPFSERFLFQPSLAFCILLASLFIKLRKKIKVISEVVFAITLILLSSKTISRNGEWKNNETLFLHDVISAPNSARTTWCAAEIFRSKAEKETNEKLKSEFLQEAVKYGEKSLEIYPRYPAACISLGLAYYAQFNFTKAGELWLKAYQLDTTSKEAKICLDILSADYYKMGNRWLDQGSLDDAINCYSKSTELNNLNVEAWYNLGGIYFLKNDSVKAYKAWEQVKKLDPNHRLNRDEFTIQ